MTIAELAKQIYAEGFRFATITDEECTEALRTVGLPDRDANVWALLTALTDCRLAELMA